MRRLTAWLDRTAEGLCRWLDSILPGRHILAGAGQRLAGLRPEILLPVDRRRGPAVLHMSYNEPGQHDGMTEMLKKSQTRKGRSGIETDCGFWAYCHISGDLCQGCKPASVKGSVNSLSPPYPGNETDLVKLCKVMGKDSGTFWMGCCTNPKGEIRIIAFGDCCSTGPPPHKPCYPSQNNQCDEWPAAKDWCFTSKEDAKAAKKTYYCTVVIDMGECTA